MAVFPKCLKNACITFVNKKRDPTNPGNYRPISILPVLSKIFERALYNRLTNFLSQHAIISPSQFGFRKGKSTKDAIIYLTELNDTVNHLILIRKLEKYGIRGMTLHFFQAI